MRLRMVVPRYGATISGGSERLVRDMARALTDRGWGVEVWTTTALDERTWRNALPAGLSLEDGVPVRRFRTVMRRRPTAFHQVSRIFFRLPSRLRPERAWLAIQGPVAPGLLRSLSEEPSVPTLFTPYLYHPTIRGARAAPSPRLLIPAAHDERPLRLRCVGTAIGAMDGLLYGTPEERELVESVHPLARRLPARVGSVGVETCSDTDPRRFSREHGLSAPYLLYGGRVATGKGLEELLRGMARLRERRPDACLVLTGEAGTHVRAAPGVHPAGHLSDEVLRNAVAGAAAVVVPSALESLSLLALQAWAVARPCILNADSAVLRGQGARSGGAVLYRGPEEFANAASALLDDPERGDRLGRAGRAHVEATYSWDGVAERLTSLITASSSGHR